MLRYWQFLQGVLAVQLKIFLIRLQEVRTFFRFPRRLELNADGRGRWVILYGIPYADWNATLSDRGLWSNLAGVARVLRLPATPYGSGARANDVVIGMKTQSHGPPAWRPRPATDRTGDRSARGQGKVRGLHDGEQFR